MDDFVVVVVVGESGRDWDNLDKRNVFPAAIGPIGIRMGPFLLSLTADGDDETEDDDDDTIFPYILLCNRGNDGFVVVFFLIR